MTRRFAAFIIVLAKAAAAQVPHQHHPPRSPQEYTRVLEDPSRDTWQLPDEVIRALDFKPGEVVADIGAGTGYFARRIARHVGKVYAVDIDAKLLDVAKKDAPVNLLTVLAVPDDPRLPERSVDTIFFCNVLHHITARERYYPKLARALKPGGRIVNIDFYRKPLPVGPPESMKLSEEDVIAEFRAAGFKLAKNLKLLPYQYILEFRPAGQISPQ